ncbi:hypothetical protein NDU88_007141 [Pleurodeles waltl]|uniref:Uncharacterized protein n=1 Tax=Pleurodeles waltl TaxID=8319 RepID=A0AAV7TZ06_PLEWA|nr:hypothetical protein NDU88_007141 [Pleurodeles waltl]
MAHLQWSLVAPALVTLGPPHATSSRPVRPRAPGLDLPVLSQMVWTRAPASCCPGPVPPAGVSLLRALNGTGLRPTPLRASAASTPSSASPSVHRRGLVHVNAGGGGPTPSQPTSAPVCGSWGPIPAGSLAAPRNSTKERPPPTVHAVMLPHLQVRPGAHLYKPWPPPTGHVGPSRSRG